MDTLVFATGNPHKLEEVQSLLGAGFALLCLKDLGLVEDIPETGTTLMENACQKALYVYNKTGKACFADDTGLEVDALQGAPGVHTARYAGPQKDSAANVRLLLENMKGQANRKARFKTVIAYVDKNGGLHCFEGCVEGEIATKQSGCEGFGYDPVFMPEGNRLTFAEMPLEEKNKISHRARALSKLVAFLNNK